MRWPHIGLVGMLFAAQTLVVLVGAVTLGTVTVLVGPTVFHRHQPYGWPDWRPGSARDRGKPSPSREH
ncbi:hypothetical protein Aca07nite_71990 [Actinoplanes capillaceus]|uniref:Integral membrane protein n=1 Tax=Actinoplanes campanulatus TaxID=113559 RepID=A0ABQ3WUJ5_9ACTN|nr:hypothetical protein [Actinoplanes capillaceus]GID49924.1 hypothetical protein Aca07nite_71990 [Actinoplanes capillaceus]